MKLLSLFFSFLPLISLAQHEISGYIKDTIDIIPYANITIFQENNVFIKGTVTDENGFFTLNINKSGTYILSVSYIGYENFVKRLEVSKDTVLENIILVIDITVLDEVVISGKKSIIERNADKLIFNVASSPVKSGFDGVEVLKRVPSIFIDGNDNILVQNKSATVLINGRKLNLSGGELANYIKNIDASNIEKVEIQTNASSEMDANVQGGVVNIILKENRKGLVTQFKVYQTQKGKHPNFYTSGNINYGTEKWNIYSTISLNDREDSGIVRSGTIYNNINRQLIENGGFLENSNRYTFTCGTTYQPSKKHEIGFEVYTTTNNKTNKANSEIDIYSDNLYLDKGITNTPHNRDVKYINTSINYSIKLDTLGGKINFIGDYAAQDFNSGFDATTIYEQGYYNDISERSRTNASTNIISTQLDFIKAINKVGDFSSGIKFTRTNRDNNTIGENLVNRNYIIEDSRTNSYNFAETIFASYFTISRKIINDINMKLGLRVENTKINGVNILTNTPVSQNYLDFFPSLFLSKEFKNKQSLSFSFNKRINRPNFSVLNPYVIKINDFSYQIGNPNLKPEYRNNLELAYNIKRHSFSIFYNHTSNLISGMYFPVDDAIYYQSQNVGVGKILGFDYSFGKNVTKWWYLKLGATLQNQNYYLSNQSYHSNTASFNISNDWNITKTWSIYLTAYYSAPRIYGNLEVADYFSSNLMIQKSFLQEKLKVRFYVDDIFNTIRDKNRGLYNDFVYDFYQKRNTHSFTLYAIFTLDTNNKTRKKKSKSANDVKNRL